MASGIERYRQVWRAWMAWPVFRTVVRIIAAAYLVMLALRAESGDFLYLFYRHSLDDFPISLFSQLQAIATLMVGVVGTFAMVGLPIMMVWRTKSNMTEWRSALIPNYPLPNMVVPFIISVALFLIVGCVPVLIQLSVFDLPARIAGLFYPGKYLAPIWSYQNFDQYLWWVVWPAVAAPVEALLGAILIGWLMALISTWFAAGIAAIATIYLVLMKVASYGMFSWGIPSRWLYAAQFNIEHDPPFMLTLLGTDILLAVLLFFYLARLSPRGKPLSAGDKFPWLSAVLVTPDRSRVGGMMHYNLLRRVAHRRTLGIGRRFIWIFAAYLTFVVGLSPLFTPGYSTFNHDYGFGVVMIAAVTSAVAIGVCWPQRYADLHEMELLRPAARGDFAREFGLAMLSDAAEISFAWVGAMLIPVAIWSPDELRSPAFWSAVVTTILSQVLVFGAVAWTMRGRSTATMIGILAVVLAAVTPLIDHALSRQGLLVPFVAACFGILLAADAYRRWLAEDIL